MDAQKEYEIIKALVDHGGNKERAAATLACSRRTIDRHIAGYKAEGKAYFIHGNQGRQPSHTLSPEVKHDILDHYVSTYYDANFAHFTELIGERHQIFLSESTVRNILQEAEILSPLANRKTKRAMNAKLKAQLAQETSKKESRQLQSKLVAIEDAHPRRPRCSRFGEMIQMDASLHLWFGEEKATLHLAVDDATGMIVGAWFQRQETLKGYYHVLHQILTNYGIPFMFYTDRRTVFEYRKSGSSDQSEDTFTQFSYACKTLGILIETTSIPQAKGRIERLNHAMQTRLPVEFRLEGVSTIEQANECLPRLIAKYNAKFALKLHSIPSVFEMQPSAEKIDLTLAVLTERTVDDGHSLRFENNFYRTLKKDGSPVYFRKGTKGLVVRTFSHALFFSSDEGVFALEQIPTHQRASKNFDPPQSAPQPKKISIPAPSHPWRRASFSSFCAKQDWQHRRIHGHCRQLVAGAE